MKDDNDACKAGRNSKSARLTSEDRKLRNRLSQKAFRARQTMRIKELEERLDSRPVSESERISELEDRNTFLANRLFECHKKLESLQVTIKALSESTAEALDLVMHKNKIKDFAEDADGQTAALISDQSARSEASREEGERDFAAPEPKNTAQKGISVPHVSFETTHHEEETTLHPSSDWPEFSTDYEEIPDDFQYALRTAMGHNSDAFALLGPFNEPPPNDEIPILNASSPLLWNDLIPDPVMQQQLSYTFPQLGYSAYAAVETNRAVLVRGPHGRLHRTNSSWSDHITMLEYFLSKNWKHPELSKQGAKASFDGLSSSASFMLSIFICLSWPTMAAWHTYTRAHVTVGSLMAWRLNPTPERFAAIDRSLTPTKLQLSVPHPAIIDWVPYATIRDKLIVCHAANPSLDDLICDIGNSYVMEIDLARLIAGIPPTRGYVGVWDLVRSIAPEATAGSNGAGIFESDFESSPETIDDFDEGEDLISAGTLPASDASALFGTRALALEAFKMTGMHKGVGNFLLDPQFFERHPELCDSRTNLMARGVPLRPGDRKFMSSPRPLDSGVLGRYKELSSWSLSLTSAMIKAN